MKTTNNLFIGCLLQLLRDFLGLLLRLMEDLSCTLAQSFLSLSAFDNAFKNIRIADDSVSLLISPPCEERNNRHDDPNDQADQCFAHFLLPWSSC